jgi:large subunit ribosomal protein L24
MAKLRKNDNVVVLTGRDKGRQTTILQVIGDDRLLLEGVNVVKRHTKGNPNPSAGQPGGIREKEMPIHHSNVAIFNQATKKADKVGFKLLNDGKKVRIYKSTGEAID